MACLTDWELDGFPEALTCYRVNAEGLSASFYRQFDSWMEMVEKTAEYAPELVEECGALAKRYSSGHTTADISAMSIPDCA
ncbi:MAG: hypothetical protein AAFY30_16320 [Cyanobacteria bacterium J06642_12]